MHVFKTPNACLLYLGAAELRATGFAQEPVPDARRQD